MNDNSIIQEKKPLKILIISFDWVNMFDDNIGQVIEKMKRDRLAPELNQIFFVCWSKWSYYKQEGNILTKHIKAPIVENRILCDLLSIFYLPYIIYKYKFKPDIILPTEFPFVLSALIPRLIWSCKIFFFLGALPTDLAKTRTAGNLKSLYYKFFESIGHCFIDRFFAIGEATRQYLINTGVRSQEITVINPDIIMRDKQFIDKSQSGLIKKKYNLSPDRKIILSVGRLEPEKGYSDLLNAFASINHQNLTLIIAGEGFLKESLMELSKNFKIEDQVIFAGNITRTEIWNYYLDADIFVLLSISEGLGLVLWEAMYMNVPVIGSRVGGIVDSIGEDGLRGYFWNPTDELEKLDDVVSRYLSSDKEVVEIKERARKYVEEKMQYNKTINDYYKNKYG